VDKEVIGQINQEFLLLVGVTHEDTIDQVNWLAAKIAGLRLSEHEEERMNRSLQDVDGQILSVSQFTLYRDVKKGRRPAFMEAAKPDVANELYESFNEHLRAQGLTVETGQVGAMMDIALINDGTVTLILEKEANA
jgi:D-tyrosyl-tRNA(Tyr) deacylase